MNFDTGQDSYVAFRNIAAERTDKIVAWVGSGLSADAGLPTWQDLRQALARALLKKASSLDDEGEKELKKACAEIEVISDNWLAFERLKLALGETTFRDTIRELLKAAHTVSIPSTYTNLWKIRISGLINLNIDRIATRARQSETESAVIEFSGKHVGDHLHALNSSPQPFILNLHGKYDEYTSWVFTRSELNELRRSRGYTEFIRTCLLSSTVLFIGITADDEAVGGHLQELAKIGTDRNPHFWLTSRRDKVTDDWAESLGIRIIRYEAKGGNHGAVNEFFADLMSYVPKDEPAPPVKPPTIPNGGDTEDDPNKLLTMDSESIRKILNKKANDILSQPLEDAYAKYEEFFKKYDEVIYRAWYTHDNSKLLGFDLEKLHDRGAFGRVYKARDHSGNLIAIKVLLEEERKKSEFLQSFRRGVRSMRILTDCSVDGIVGYREAYEIPCFVVMDWIEGPNLDIAVKAKWVRDWYNILKIARDLSRIIENAHHTPERVLHRDLRPPNIMLQGFHEDRNRWKVVVLDFDLSWHLGASEKSVVSGTSTGYLAPEQIQPVTGVSTRHSAVDSFGLGMTMFFLISQRDPYPAENMHARWETEVLSYALNLGAPPSWESIPTRFARLIINSTKQAQHQRWDVNQIRGELERLLEALMNPDQVESAELIAEEIISRTKTPYEYQWNCDKLEAVIDFKSGARISLIGHESKKQIRLCINWVYAGGSTQKQLSKKIAGSFDDIKRQLNAARWSIEDKSKSGRVINFVAHLDVRDARRRINEIARNLDSVVSTFYKLTSP